MTDDIIRAYNEAVAIWQAKGDTLENNFLYAEVVARLAKAGRFLHCHCLRLSCFYIPNSILTDCYYGYLITYSRMSVTMLIVMVWF